MCSTSLQSHQARYQQAVSLCEQGLCIKKVACQLRIHERTVRHWFRGGVAPDVRPRRKRQSDFDSYAPYVLKRWQDGERNGTRIWEEIATEALSRLTTHGLSLSLDSQENGGENPCANASGVHYTSKAAVCLFMRHPDTLDEDEREDLTALRQAHSALGKAYGLTQDFLQMLHKREGERLDSWLAQVQESQLPELQRFAVFSGTG